MHRATTTPHAIAASDNRGIKTTGHTFEAFEAQMAVPWPVRIGEVAAPRDNSEPDWGDNAKTWLPSTLLTLWCLGLLDSNYFGL